MFQPLFGDINDHDAVYSELLIRTQKCTDAMSPGKDKEKLTRRMKEITDRWLKVSRTAKEKHEKISNLYPSVVDYDEGTAVTEKAIKLGEDYLKAFSPAALDVEESRSLLFGVRVWITS